MSGMKIWRTLEVLEKEGNNNVKNERETFRLRERERERESKWSVTNYLFMVWWIFTLPPSLLEIDTKSTQNYKITFSIKIDRK